MQNWQNQSDSGYICYFKDYISGESADPGDELFFELPDVHESMERVLIYPNNFWGVMDETGYALQFSVNEDFSVTLEIAQPERDGSLFKTESLDHFIALMQKAGRHLHLLEVDGVEFRSWWEL